MSNRVGNIGEAALVLKAIKNGFRVLTPFINTLPYDVVLDNYTRFIKIQVKTSKTLAKGYKHRIAFRFSTTHNIAKNLYDASEVDFFAFYIVNLDIFYFIPINKINYKTLTLFPFDETNKFNEFKDNWEILRG